MYLKKPNQQHHQKYSEDTATPSKEIVSSVWINHIFNTPLVKCFSSYITHKSAHFNLSIILVQFIRGSLSVSVTWNIICLGKHQILLIHLRWLNRLMDFLLFLTLKWKQQFHCSHFLLAIEISKCSEIWSIRQQLGNGEKSTPKPPNTHKPSLSPQTKTNQKEEVNFIWALGNVCSTSTGIIISSRSWELQEFTTSYQDGQYGGDCTKITFLKIQAPTFE